MLGLVLAGALAAALSTGADREELALTIYNQNFGLVREVRQLDLPRGEVTLEFSDVAARIQPETVAIRALGGGLNVLEQNYLYDLLSPEKLLSKYVGRRVKIYRWNEKLGRDEAHDAEVLATNGGTILRIGNEITFGYPGRLAFPEIPENLIAKPTLRWLLDSRKQKPRVEVSYLTRELNWKADYVLVLDAANEHASLNAWVTLTNQSGTSYENTRLKLVAGDVQRVGDRVDYRKEAKRARLASAVAEDAFREEGFFEYHLYTLQRRTTLHDNEQKQVALLEADQVGIVKRLIFESAAHWYRGAYPQPLRNQKVGVFIEFENAEQNRLGMPLPKGVIRLYQADTEGAQQFVGEDRIEHTPRDETVRLKTGEAFDVVADRKQTDFEITGQCTSESAYSIELRNHKDNAETVEILERVGGDWKIQHSTHHAEKEDAHSFRFTVEVPSRGKTRVEYRVRVRWC
jgi:hypothetical protein